jgi:hypothetical protein
MVLVDFLDRNLQRLCHVLLIVPLLQYHNSIQDRHFLLQSAIVHPRKSLWQRLYANDNASSFLHVTGLNQYTFVMLLNYVFDLEEIAHHCSRRCPHLLYPEWYFGLLLLYLGSMMNYKHLCLIFGITLSVCSRAVICMLKKVVRALWGHPFMKVQFPNRKKMRELANMIKIREPMVGDIMGFMDSISFLAECTDKRVKQNAMYCSYKCNTMVNNVFTYDPDGKVFFAAINFPGSWADGSLTAHFLHQMKS